MSDGINAAIEELLGHLRTQEQEVLETKRTINSLRRRIKEEPLFTDAELDAAGLSSGTITQGQFYGKPLATVVQQFLEMKRRSCSTEEIVAGLERGAFDFRAQGWKDDDRLRALAISLSKNSKTFHRLPDGSFGLLTWYPEVIRRAGKNKAATKDAAEVETSDAAPNEDTTKKG